MLGGLRAPLGHQTAFLVPAALAVLNTIVTYFSLPEPPTMARQQAATAGGRRVLPLALRGPHALFFLLAAGTTLLPPTDRP